MYVWTVDGVHGGVWPFAQKLELLRRFRRALCTRKWVVRSACAALFGSELEVGDEFSLAQVRSDRDLLGQDPRLGGKVFHWERLWNLCTGFRRSLFCMAGKTSHFVAHLPARSLSKPSEEHSLDIFLFGCLVVLPCVHQALSARHTAVTRRHTGRDREARDTLKRRKEMRKRARRRKRSRRKRQGERQEEKERDGLEQ